MDKLKENSLTIGTAIVLTVALVWGFGLGGKSIETVTKEVVKEIRNEPTVGGTNPDVISPYLRWGGVATYANRTDQLNQASTTICAIQAPPATSTLRFDAASVRLDISSTTATAVRAHKSSTQYAATTFLFGDNVAANATAAIVATSSGTSYIFGPNQWLVVTMTGGTGTMSPTGSCQAQFITI